MATLAISVPTLMQEWATRTRMFLGLTPGAGTC
jgi:hypothetical protein